MPGGIGEEAAAGQQNAEEEKKEIAPASEKEKILDYLFKHEKRIATRHTQLLGPKVFLNMEINK